MAIKQCEGCGREFDPNVYTTDGRLLQTRPHARFCSRQCSNSGRKRRVTLRCDQCGALFELAPWERSNHGHPRRFCGLECRNAHQRAHPSNPPKGRKVARGYVLLYRPEHPYARRGYVPEHRLVIEQTMGRYLLPGEQVHHINHVRDDNRPENLQHFATTREHLQLHWATDPAFFEGIPSQTRSKRTGQCDNCGQPVTIRNVAQWQRREHHYCSRECAQVARRTTVERTCERCGKTFSVQEYRVKAGTGRFCSNACKVFSTALRRLKE